MIVAPLTTIYTYPPSNLKSKTKRRRSYAAENISTHNPNNIDFVLSIMDKDLPPETLQRYREQGIAQTHVKKRDERDENLLEIFEELCAVLEGRLLAGQRVLVHCVMGISRSVSVVCAFGEFVGVFRYSSLQVLFLFLLSFDGVGGLH